MNARAKTKPNNIILRMLLTPEIGILIPLIVLMVFTGLREANFFSIYNLTVILRYATFMGIICIAQAVIIMTGEIDISIGSNLCFSGIVFGTFAITLGMPPVISIAAAIIAGGVIGFINGFLVARVGVINFIATLSTMYVCQGLATAISNGVVITPLGPVYDAFSQARPLNLSWSFFIFLAMFLIMEFVIRKTKYGRMVQSIGGNVDAAYCCGINVRKVKWAVYVMAGLFAGLAGVLMSISQASASPTAGIGLEFRTVAACAVGGVSLTGGSGSILGSGIGILFIYVLSNCLQILSIESNWQMVITGTVLILAVLFDLTKKKLTAADSIN